MVDQKIVDFALAELNWGDCHKKDSRVEDFKTTEGGIPGILYTFHLEGSGDKLECLTEDLNSCSISVYSEPWKKKMSVNWYKSTCKPLTDEMLELYD